MLWHTHRTGCQTVETSRNGNKITTITTTKTYHDGAHALSETGT